MIPYEMAGDKPERGTADHETGPVPEEVTDESRLLGAGVRAFAGLGRHAESDALAG